MFKKPQKKDKGDDYTFAGKSRDDQKDEAQAFVQNIHLSSFDPLEKMDKDGRKDCPKCNKLRKFFCYDCMTKLETEHDEMIPQLDLPVDVVM
jgi:hypothetical protein